MANNAVIICFVFVNAILDWLGCDAKILEWNGKEQNAKLDHKNLVHIHTMTSVSIWLVLSKYRPLFSYLTRLIVLKRIV